MIQFWKCNRWNKSNTKEKYFMIPPVWANLNRQTHINKKQNIQGLEEWGNGGLEFQFGCKTKMLQNNFCKIMWNFWKWRVLMIPPHLEYTKWHWSISLKLLRQLILCYAYFTTIKKHFIFFKIKAFLFYSIV